MPSAEKKAARALQQRYHQAVAAYRDAENDNGRAEAAAEIKQVLEIYYQADMETRQQELKQIAERLKKLEAQLARRTEKKQEIVDLQLKVVLNEAEGLGFSGSNAVLNSLPDILVTPGRFSSGSRSGRSFSSGSRSGGSSSVREK